MRKSLLFLMTSLALVFASCKDENEDEESKGGSNGSTQTDLVGDWKLIEWRDYDIEGTFANMNITFANMEDKEYESYTEDKEYYSFTPDGVWYEITIEGRYQYSVNKCNVSTKNGQLKIIKQTGATGLTHSDNDLDKMSDKEIVDLAKKSNFSDYGGLMELSNGMTMDYKIINGQLYVIDNNFGSSVSIYTNINKNKKPNSDDDNSPVPADQTGLKFRYYESSNNATVTGLEAKDLKEVKIPSKVIYDGNVFEVTKIGIEAFIDCENLTSIVIGNSVKTIGNAAFDGCTSLKSIVIGNSVTTIEHDAFYYCTSLTSIEIPNSVTEIGEDAFDWCESLTSIVVDKDNKVYDSRENCNAIIKTSSNTLIAGCQNTVIPNSVTKIDMDAFYGCTGLTSIEIPNSVTEIGYEAFYYCTSLTSIEIPNSVTYIGSYAFENCTSLTSIVIGNSVKTIGEGAFWNCTSLTSIVVDKDNKVYDSRENCNAIIETASNTLIIGCHNTVIPNSVTEIGSYAFSGCTNLTSIEIPNSVTEIGSGAFYDCTKLKTARVPKGLDIRYASFPSTCEIERY